MYKFEQAVPYLKALKDRVRISEGYAENAERFLKQFGDTIDDVQLPRWEYGECQTLLSVALRMLSSEGILYRVELTTDTREGLPRG